MTTENPFWLTKEFVKEALENGNKYSIHIENMDITNPVPAGDNYLSVIHGVVLEYKKSNDTESLSKTTLIIKSPIVNEDPITAEWGNDLILKELIIYKELSPKLDLIFCGDDYKNYNENDDQLLAKSYFSSTKDVLIMEDLKLKGYKVADRLKQFDFEHCVLALKALAKFHAGSVIIQEKEPEFIKNNVGQDVFFREQQKLDNRVKDFTVSSLKLLGDMLEKWPEVKKYSSWFQLNGEKCWDLILDSIRRDCNEFNVLTHGDYWVANMLFKYDDNNIPYKIKIIDFQLSAYTSPAIDFMCFMDCSAQEKIRIEKYDDLLNVYINELNAILARYECNKLLDKSEFKKSLIDRAMYRICCLVNILPFVLADLKSSEVYDVKDAKPDAFDNLETHPLISYLKNERFIKIATKILDELHDIGVITAE